MSILCAYTTDNTGSSTPGCEPNCFIPNPVTISVGETVTWDNTDTAAHTATGGSAADEIIRIINEKAPMK